MNNRPQAATRTKPPSRVPGWVWLFTGAVLGAFIMFLMHLSRMPAIDPATADPEISAEADGEVEQPRFDFYKLLKESTVPVFEPEDVAPPAEAEPEELAQYLLQVASFKDPGDAEQLRAELLLLNLDAHVETATVRNGEIWHRVLVGPFDSRSNLAKARSVLVSNQMEALILKRAAKG